MSINFDNVESLRSLETTNTGVRQTIQSSPDMEATPSTIETAATKTGDLRSTYHDLGMDMLTGSRGGMSLLKSKSVASNYLQSSLLSEAQSILITDTTALESSIGSILQQFLGNGLQLGSYPTSANLYTFQTTHKTVIDGNEWHYNPVSGFAMCKYHPDPINTAMDLQHPMGKVPMFIAIKDLDGVRDWTTGRASTSDGMYLNLTNAEGGVDFTGAPTDTYIGLGTASRLTAANMFLFGWFGDTLDDLQADMTGERGVTASWLSTGAQTVDTGITDIQQIIFKDTTTAGDWVTLNKASGFGNFTILNDTDAETTQTIVTVAGSEVTFVSHSLDYLVIVIGSTADAPDNKLKAGTKVLRKVGTGASGHRVDLGAAFSGGDNGGMVFGRDVGAVTNNYVIDTINGANNFLVSTGTSILTAAAYVEAFLTTGIQVGASGSFNDATNINQYTAFNTTHKVTTGDGLNWEYNPITGFAMCKYTGDGIAGRTLTHPMGKKLRMGWFKELTGLNSWAVYLDNVGATKYMYLDTTIAAAISNTFWDDTEPDNTTITLGFSGKVNLGTEEYIFYGWFGDDLSDIETGLTGERGASAFWQYTGGSGAMSVDTGIDNITGVLYKKSSVTGDWIFTKKPTSYDLNDTGIESVGGWDIEGSIITWAGGTDTAEFIAFGSKADSGVDNDVILPSTEVNPTIASMANGFGRHGNIDTITKLITSQTLNITGDAGKKFIYLKQDDLLYFTDQRPEYLRDYVPYAKGNYVYDIPGAQMYNTAGTVESVVFIGECMVDNLGNVYDIKTYARGDFWESDELTPVALSSYYFDNPWGHIQLDTQAYTKDAGILTREGYTEINSTVRGINEFISQDIIELYTNAKIGIRTTFPEGLLIKIRRTF